jgi:hypothetical protein
MDIEIVIYGIIGALAILVCWLLDIYSPTMEKESISMYATEILSSEKSPVILPTCCFCHKIRDDHGNWHERSEYQADYQGVIFTHTFCHECALIHYAEFYQGAELESSSTQ